MFPLTQITTYAVPVVSSIGVALGVTVSSEVADHSRERAAAYETAAEAGCERALPAFQQLAARTGRAADHLAAANCALELGERERAIGALQVVLAHRSELDRADQVYALRTYAYQAEAVGDRAGAAAAWADAFDVSTDAADAVQAARTARVSGNRAAAAEVLAEVRETRLEGETLAAFLAERAYVHSARGRHAAAVDDLARAITVVDTAELRFRHGLALAEAGMARSAIHSLERARQGLGDDPDLLLPLAYAYRNTGQTARAAALFQQAWREDQRMARFARDFEVR